MAYWSRLRSRPVGYRDRQILKGSAATLLYRGTAVIANVVTVPLLYNTLGRERFGVVMALLAAGIAVSFGDLGIGNGLQNYLARVQDDRPRAAAVLKTGLAYATAIAACVAFLALATLPRLDLPAIFGTSAIAPPDLVSLSSLLVVLLSVQIPLSLGQRVLAAYQRTHVHAAFMTVGNLVMLAAVIVTVLYHPTPGAALVSVLAPQVLANGAALGYAIHALNIPLGSAALDLSRHLVHELLLTGLVFFAVQGAFTAHATSDSLLVSSHLGAATLSDYTLVMRVIAVLVLPISALVAPLLGSLNDALARTDRAWLRQNLRRVAGFALLNLAIVVTGFWVFAEAVLGLWIGRPFDLSPALLLSFAALLAFQCLSIPVSVGVMTAPLLHRSAIIYCVAVAVAIATKAYALETAGLPAFNFASAVALSLLYVLPAGFLIFRRLYRADSNPILQTSSK